MGGMEYKINEIQNEIFQDKEIEVEDQDTGEVKKVKTVSRAEVATVVAYMLGIEDSRLEKFYSHHYSLLLEQLRKDKGVTAIRYLSKIRTTLMNHFLNIDNEMRYNLSNLDRMPYFDKAEINKLFMWGIYVVQPNFRSDKYMLHLTKLIDENIDACKKFFPESIKFEYIRSLFVIPHYDRREVMKNEYDKFRGKKMLYPFQMYMYWEPVECGYLLYSDAKFLEEIYRQHGEVFLEGYKYRDASDETKANIYSFIHESKSVVMVVDCENSDPYKLYGVIKNLDPEDLLLVQKIILYDDYHTSIAWDYIEKMISIPVEHIEVPRVTDAKSLVDIQMAVGVSAAHYRDQIDSFILCSSDSDFWGLISSLPMARFLVMYEYSKCGDAIKEALSSRSIFHCAMDDFYRENAGGLQKAVLKKVLERYLPNIVGENGWELTRQIYSDAYIFASEQEMKRFYEKYIKTLRLKINDQGEFYVSISQ